MANVINNISDVGKVIAKLAAGMLADKTQFLQNIDKEPASSFDQVNGYNIGQTIMINKPARFVPSTNPDITSTLQDVVEEKTTLTLDTRQVVPVALTSAEIQNTLRLKDWANRILDPAVSSIAQAIEANFLVKAKNAVYNNVGTPGSTIFDTSTMLLARQGLMKNLVDANGPLKALLDSVAMRSAVDSRKGYLNAASAISSQYTNGEMGKADGFTFYENNLLPVHTRGTQTQTGGTITTTSTEGATTLAITGTSGGTLLAGDNFTIAGVFMVHPITKVSTGILQPFVVTANNTASSTAYTGVQISPAVYASSNGLQNVNALPQSGAAIVFTGAAGSNSTQNFAFHKSAFRFASVPLMKPDGAHMVGQETVDGMTIRVWMDANILQDKMIMRLDFLGGFAAVRPEWSVRIAA